MTGGIDWMWGVAPENADLLSQAPNIDVVSAATMRMSFLALDAAGRTGDDTPFKKQKVRQAIAHAIDRESLSKNLVGAGSAVLKSFCAPVQAGCDTDVKQYDYDPEEAKKLLAEAGYPDGFKTTFYAYRDRPYTEAVLNYLRAVGIQTDLQFLQWGALRPLIVGDKTPIAHDQRTQGPPLQELQVAPDADGAQIVQHRFRIGPVTIGVERDLEAIG